MCPLSPIVVRQFARKPRIIIGAEAYFLGIGHEGERLVARAVDDAPRRSHLPALTHGVA
jgi:hypothetical protein